MPPGSLAAQVVHHSPRCHLDQPPPRIVGNAFSRPLHGCRYQRLLHGILRSGKVVIADHRTEHLRREFTQQLLGKCGRQLVCHGSSSCVPFMICLTSIGMLNGVPSGPGAPDICAAIS